MTTGGAGYIESNNFFSLIRPVLYTQMNTVFLIQLTNTYEYHKCLHLQHYIAVVYVQFFSYLLGAGLGLGFGVKNLS